MKQIIISILLTTVLTGCSAFKMHITPIEQGNVITRDQVARLHRGMSESAVRNILGNPVLTNTFSPHRLDYVYTLKTSYDPLVEKQVVCVFRNGRLSDIQQTFTNGH